MPVRSGILTQLKTVQNFALRICAHSWNIDHHILLDMFHIPTLAARREFLSITTFHKIATGSFYFPPNMLVPLSPTRPTRSYVTRENGFNIPFARTLSFKSSYIPRTTCLWNNLCVEYANTSINEFRSIVRNMLL